MKKKIVCIHWRDPTIDSGWVDDDHADDLPMCYTYGILIRGGDPTVVAGTVTEEGNYADRTKFPKGVITSIEVIGEVNVKGKKK